MIHRLKYVVFCLAALLLPSGPMASAGTSVPTWIEDVQLNYYLDINGQPAVSASGSPIRGLTFSVDNFYDGRNPSSGFADEALVDYQNVTGPLVLYVDYATLNGGTESIDPVQLAVYSYSPSAEPPQINAPPEGSDLGTINLVGGYYQPHSYAVTLPTPASGGPVCYLLVAANSEDIDGPETIGLTAVPEPSSLLTLILGIGGASLAYTTRRTRKQPGPRTLATQ